MIQVKVHTEVGLKLIKFPVYKAFDSSLHLPQVAHILVLVVYIPND